LGKSNKGGKGEKGSVENLFIFLSALYSGEV